PLRVGQEHGAAERIERVGDASGLDRMGVEQVADRHRRVPGNQVVVPGDRPSTWQVASVTGRYFCREGSGGLDEGLSRRTRGREGGSAAVKAVDEGNSHNVHPKN